MYYYDPQLSFTCNSERRAFFRFRDATSDDVNNRMLKEGALPNGCSRLFAVGALNCYSFSSVTVTQETHQHCVNPPHALNMADDQPPNKASDTGKNAYVTLLTRSSYLAGAILLAFTLHKHSPNTPLIITYTPETLSEPIINALKVEANHSNIILHPVMHLRLPEDGTESGMVAERFIDTWTKLRVLDLHEMEQKFERICWLDADMMVFSDPSPLIFNEENDAYLKGGDGMRLMAVHTCVCNLDHDSWAPETWKPDNCAMTHLTYPDQIAHVEAESETLSNFNSGTFVYRPSAALSIFVKQIFEKVGNKTLRAMQFPDQDFLNHAFATRWASLSWRTNALKTWRYWHTNIWRDNQVAVLHYIVDKPWTARLDASGTAGYLGRDGETHGWWWSEYDKWYDERNLQGEKELLEIVGRFVAGGGGEAEMRAIGGGAQDFAKKWPAKSSRSILASDGETEVRQNGDRERDKDNEGFLATDYRGPVLRSKMLGERGHGPVVRGKGRGSGEGWCATE